MIFLSTLQSKQFMPVLWNKLEDTQSFSLLTETWAGGGKEIDGAEEKYPNEHSEKNGGCTGEGAV